MKTITLTTEQIDKLQELLVVECAIVQEVRANGELEEVEADRDLDLLHSIQSVLAG